MNAFAKRRDALERVAAGYPLAAPSAAELANAIVGVMSTSAWLDLEADRIPIALAAAEVISIRMDRDLYPAWEKVTVSLAIQLGIELVAAWNDPVNQPRVA